VNVDLPSIVTVVCIYAIMAVSIYLPMALGDLFLLPIGTMGFGAYTYGYFGSHGTPLPLAILLAIAVAVAVGAVIGRLVLRLRGLGSALVTLGIIEIIAIFFMNFDPIGATQGMTGIPKIGSMWTSLAVAILAIVLTMFIEGGRRGTIINAVDKDILAAECIGIPTKRLRFGMNVASAFLSAIAGIMLAGYLTFISPDQFGLAALNRYLMATIMGGSTAVLGPVVGAVIEGGIPQYNQLLIFSVFVIVLLLVRKQGLITRRDLERIFGKRRVVVGAGAPLPAQWAGATLRVEGIRKSYGGLHVLDDVGFSAQPGRVLGIIGPNGAGKTTLLNILSGVIGRDDGTIALDGAPVNVAEPHQAVRLGIARTFQNLRVYGEMTVEENLAIVDPALAPALMTLAGIESVRETPAGALPYGQQRRLEIARALALQPRVLLLDEPTAGMTHEESADVARIVDRLRKAGLTVILVEHNLPFLTTVADHVIVLDAGRLIAEGTHRDVLSDTKVIEAYLGKPMASN
jgi:branched-chain amino acid transport system permease protein